MTYIQNFRPALFLKVISLPVSGTSICVRTLPARHSVLFFEFGRPGRYLNVDSLKTMLYGLTFPSFANFNFLFTSCVDISNSGFVFSQLKYSLGRFHPQRCPRAGLLLHAIHYPLCFQHSFQGLEEVNMLSVALLDLLKRDVDACIHVSPDCPPSNTMYGYRPSPIWNTFLL
jgi:hypothetical protein